MKPLTIEQLKALEVGDWVWIKAYKSISLELPKYEGYVGIAYNTDNGLHSSMFYFKYSDYGDKWLAYKNKEQAEAKGEIVELPCEVGDPVWVVYYEPEEYEYKIFEAICFGFDINENPIRIITNFCCYDYCRKGNFTDKAEAERRLAELNEE